MTPVFVRLENPASSNQPDKFETCVNAESADPNRMVLGSTLRVVFY